MFIFSDSLKISRSEDVLKVYEKVIVLSITKYTIIILLVTSEIILDSSRGKEN